MQQTALQDESTAAPPSQPFQPSTVSPRRFATVGPGGALQREVFGFGLLSSLADPNLGYPSWNFNLLSTVALFGLHVCPYPTPPTGTYYCNGITPGSFAPDPQWTEWNSSAVTGLLNTAHAAGTKVVLTIVLQDFSSGTPYMCQGLAARAVTVQQTASEVRAKGVDGVNIDYEGLGGTCANGVDPQSALTDLARQLRAALPSGAYLSIDTYASSAGDPSGFFNIPNLNQYVDSFFVMAYDSDYSNYSYPPLSCSHYCLNPISPLTGYYYNDTRAALEYGAAVPSTKVILGLPYYGRWVCVNSWAPNQYPATGWIPQAISYLGSRSIPSDPSNSNYVVHRDTNDSTGMTPWSTWTSASNPTCPVESYWDDTTSLGQKYDLVNRANMRGVGIWNLGDGGASPELWSSLSTYFSCPVTLSTPSSQTTTAFNVSINGGGCSVASFDVQVQDATLNQAWASVKSPTPSSGGGTAIVNGYPGHSYQVRARAHSTGGVTGAWAYVTTAVASTATYSHPFKGLYTLDGYGDITSDDSPPLGGGPAWPGWRIARAAHPQPGANSPQAGLVLDGWGGLHPYGVPGLTVTAGPYWPNWDIARDFAWLPNGTGGYVLDGWGGLHPFAVNGNPLPPVIQGNAYWPNWDIAKKVVIFSDGNGGYTLDGWGGIHGFGIGGAAPVADGAVQNAYWPNWNIARDIVLLPNSHSGYTLDGWGGIHPFAPTGQPLPAPLTGSYWPNWDIARGLILLPGSSSAGYTLDGWQGTHPFGAAAPIADGPYTPNQDIAINLLGS